MSTIKWKELLGESIILSFNTSKIVGKILSYDTRRRKVYLKIEDEVYKIQTDGLKKEKFKKMLFDITHSYNIGETITDDGRDFTIIDKFYYHTFLYKVRCNKCGYTGIVSCIDIFNKIYKCSCCYGHIVVNGINDINTIEPWMSKYFIGGEEEASLYTFGSTAKLYFKCPYCGKVKDKSISISQLRQNKKLSCSCNDKFSYPEKFFRELLNDKKIDYIHQTNKEIFPWSESYRYDFYLPKYNLIIETHGEQHYKNKGFYKTLCFQKENDLNKKELAKKNGIYNYFEIDCSKSNKEYIKNSIEESNLLNILNVNISDEEYQKYSEMSYKNLIKEVCDYFSKYGGTPTEIGNVYKLHQSTVNKYLKIGNEYNWCNYNPKINLKNGAIKTASIRTVNKNKYYGKIIVFNEHDQEVCRCTTQYETKDFLNKMGIKISVSSIGQALKRENHKAKGFSFYYENDLKLGGDFSESRKEKIIS